MEERNCFVYEDYRMDNWTCCYVGMGSKNEENGYNRFEVAERNDHHDNIMNSYGIARVIIRDNLTRKEANALEEARIYYYVFALGYTIDIKGYRKGERKDSHLTNQTWGGDGIKGCNPYANKTEEELEKWKKKNSEAHQGEKHPMYGRTGEKNPMWGKHHSEESKKKMRIPVIGVNIKTKEEIELSSAKQGEEYGFDGGHITQCCKGKVKQHKGYKFYYKSDYEKLSKEDIEKDLKNALLGKQRPVIGINIKTNEIINLDSAKQGKEFGFNPSDITQCCKDKLKTYKGFKFYYKSDYLALQEEETIEVNLNLLTISNIKLNI